MPIAILAPRPISISLSKFQRLSSFAFALNGVLRRQAQWAFLCTHSCRGEAESFASFLRPRWNTGDRTAADEIEDAAQPMAVARRPAIFAFGLFAQSFAAQISSGNAGLCRVRLPT